MQYEARHQNEALLMFIAGAAAGAAFMYMMDPSAGRRRRAVARDKAYSALHTAEDRAAHKARDLRNRAKGTVATVRNRFTEDKADDDVLRARVRAELGHICSHPRAIEIAAYDGCVTLSGNALHNEIDAICSGIGKVRGVREVRHSLVPHESPGSVPELQG